MELKKLMRKKAVPNQDPRDARDLFEKMRSIDIILHRQLWQKLALNEKPGAIKVMIRLYLAPEKNPQGLRVSELAATFGITASSITQLVTGLEERGYVGRTMDPEDRRAVRVSLTEAGRRLAEPMREAIDSIFSGIVLHLGHEKSRMMLALLNEVIQYFYKPVDQDACVAFETVPRS
jgi:DNA-binding MarR family transcriptional regulator